MSILHAKCTVCSGSVSRFGGRRRLCSQCGRTWSVRPRKRGRRPLRTGSNLPELILLDRHCARQLVPRYNCSAAVLRYRTRKRMDVIAKRPGQLLIPEGNLVLMVDGLWCTFRGRYWVLYNMAVKPVTENVAYLLDPIQRCGRENARGWDAAINTIPMEIRERIRALISDGLPGFEVIAQQQGWINQFCHRHLIASLESKLGRHRRQLGSRWLRERIYAAVCDALVTTDEHQLELLEEQLKHLVERWDCTRKLRWTVTQFLRLKDSFRAHLLHPDLRLPTTTGSLESLHSLLRVAIGTANNSESAFLRTKSFIRIRQTITCNGTGLQQN